MKYLGNLFVSLKEIFIMMIMQYAILILCFIIIGPDSTVLWGSILLLVMQVIYIVYKICKKQDFKFNFKNRSYFPYVLLGIGIATVYNMIVFRINPPVEVTTDFPIILNILCSGIVGPIFEEFLFRFDLVRRLEKFNSNKWIIIILASFVFGMCHNGIATIIYALIVGIINSYIFVKDKDIIKPIIVHIAANIFVNLLTGYNLIVMILGLMLIIIGYFIIRYKD